MSLEIVHNIGEQKSFKNFLRFTNQLQCLENDVAGPLFCFIACLMLLGFVASVSFNWAALKGLSFIPMPFYLYFPTVAVVIPIFIHHTLAPAVKVHETAREYIRKQKLSVGQSSERKYLIKVICSIQPFAVYGGMLGFRLYKIKQSTRLTFYEAINSHTFNALLATSL